MAKGKKYRKWYESHKEELNRREKLVKREKPVTEAQEEKPVKIKHPVHGYFIYECERCGTVYKMYLDKGLEDHVQDILYPERHKPVPFTIMCRNCAEVAKTLKRNDYYGLCRHILWGIGDSDEYEELPEGASYFKNDPKEDCGIPVCKESYRNKDVWYKTMMAERIRKRGVEC